MKPHIANTIIKLPLGGSKISEMETRIYVTYSIRDSVFYGTYQNPNTVEFKYKFIK